MGGRAPEFMQEGVGRNWRVWQPYPFVELRLLGLSPYIGPSMYPFSTQAPTTKYNRQSRSIKAKTNSYFKNAISDDFSYKVAINRPTG